MKKTTFIFILLSFLPGITFMTGCKEKAEAPIIHDITGFVQKGPFINGSSVTVYDLQNNLVSTGKSFNTQINDNTGTFELKNISLTSNFIGLRADGFYFNEVLGEQSVSQITLYGLSDISDKSTINVNLLTHLEKSRVEYLMENGKTFSEAKSQAQSEILAIFNIEKPDMKSSEELNISEAGDDNGIILAISAILQGYRSESELTSLLSDISNDIREDGTLDNDFTGAALINHAVNLDTTSIKNNLVIKYTSIGETSDIPAFGKYLTNFIANTDFQVTGSLISYPETGSFGNNILYKTATEFVSGTSTPNSFAANIPVNGALKIKISSMSSDTINIPASDSTAASVNIIPDLWYIGIGLSSPQNWNILPLDNNTNTQIFTVALDGEPSDLRIYFDKGSFRIDYYEMNSALPTFTKEIFAR